jgi:hypothetical protein
MCRNKEGKCGKWCFVGGCVASKGNVIPHRGVVGAVYVFNGFCGMLMVVVSTALVCGYNLSKE